MEIIGGLIEPTKGEVCINGDLVTGPRDDIGMVFQANSTFPWLSVLENVAFGLRMKGVGTSERRDRAQSMIELVGLEGFEEKHPPELSGGMNQRVAIARTLVMNPEIILMDEPFGALDEQTRLILGQELLRIWKESDSTILFITHNINEAVLLSDRIIVMSARPAEFKSVLDNPLPRPRGDDIITSDDFTTLTGQLWNELKGESLEGMKRESGPERVE
jgi:NitT/TauT family transport system ATP-binding protein